MSKGCKVQTRSVTHYNTTVQQKCIYSNTYRSTFSKIKSVESTVPNFMTPYQIKRKNRYFIPSETATSYFELH